MDRKVLENDTQVPPVVTPAAPAPLPDPPAGPSELEDGQRRGPTEQTHVSSRLKLVKSSIGERPEVFRSTVQEVLFVLMATSAIMTSSFLAGTSMIITASIGRDLGMTQGEITWIGSSTSLTAGAFQLALGQLADLVGRKMMFLVGMGCFSLFSIVTGFAQNPFWMDIVCGLLGVFCAMVVPPAIGILGAAYDKPSKRKNLAFSAFSAGNPLGFVMGTCFCGIAVKLFNWRAAFFLVAILWGAFTIMAIWVVPRVETYSHQVSLRERLTGFVKTFDWVGAVLTLFGTGLFSAAITLGPTDGWRSPHIIAMLVSGILLLIIFGFWEKSYPFPLMPPHIWMDRNFTIILCITTLGYMSFTAASFWLAFFMQERQGLEPLIIAVHFLPQAIAGLIWNVVAGSVLHRINNTLIMTVAALCYTVSTILLSLTRPDSSYWAFIFPYLVLSVVGADFQFNVANMYVMQSLPNHQQALAGGIFNTLVRLSNVVAMGITTAVFSSVAVTPEGVADPTLKFTRAWQASIAMAGASLLFLPFLRGLGTQGNAPREKKSDDSSAGVATPMVIDEKAK